MSKTGIGYFTKKILW